MRNKTIPLLAATLCLFMVAGTSPGAGRHVKANLVSSQGSKITGFVEITQLPQGGSNVVVVAKGLNAETVYSSFYYESDNCTEPADLLANFNGDRDGNAQIHGRIDDDVDEVGSVSIRLGPGYGTLLACAKTR
jgi:hypothetical protein